MPDVYCVRAEYGSYAKQFLAGNYAAIGWFPETDLASIKSREELYPLYRAAHPDDTSNIVVGQQVGQIARFLLDVKGGDYLITPDLNTELLHYGIVGVRHYISMAIYPTGAPFTTGDPFRGPPSRFDAATYPFLYRTPCGQP